MATLTLVINSFSPAAEHLRSSGGALAEVISVSTNRNNRGGTAMSTK